MLIIKNKLFIQKNNRYNIYDFWIGLNDIAQENTFISSDGATSFYVNWLAGEPNNYNNEDCVHQRSNGKWNDLKCSDKRPSVCKIPFHTDMVEFEGHKYYFGTEGVLWNNARSLCIARGGDLISYRNIEEVNFIYREAVLR